MMDKRKYKRGRLVFVYMYHIAKPFILYGFISLFLIIPSFSCAQHLLDTLRTERPKVGLALSGGGAKGYAHVGTLKVLKELGIEVDYISGTSMGSIVGGLYAIGYSPEFIEDLISNQNWGDLLLDKIDRRQLTFDQKSYNEQQFISFPVTKKSIGLPFGIKYGQNVTHLLSNLVASTHQHDYFNEFQTPFLCIGTDIANGESVVLDKGNLAMAMRASMAIPTVFTPVTVDGRLLVDGGLVNNFPVKELVDRGCDIIIGVDVQSHKDYTIEDLSSITAILDRSAGFYRKARNDTAMKYVDYYIHPDMTGYGVSSFTDFDTIIDRGEKAALEHYAELKELALYLKSFPDYDIKIRDLQPLTHFVLDSLVILGNTDIPRNAINSIFDYKKGDVVEMKDLDKAIQTIYGSLYFKTVNYTLLPGNQGSILKIELEQSEFGSIGLGIHFDSDYKAGLLITSRFKNVLFKNVQLSTTLGLSENPHLSFTLYQDRGLLPSLALSGKWTSFSFIDYLGGKDKIGEYRLSNLVFDLYLQSVNKQALAFGGGFQIELSGLRNNVGIDFGVDDSRYSQNYFNFFAFMKLDKWDHSFFPHSGGKVNIRAVFVTKLLVGGNLNLGEKATVLFGEYDKAIPLSKRWTLRPKAYVGLTFGEGIYISQLFIIGGQGSHYLPGMISFTGLDVAQLGDRQVIGGRLRLQYRIFNKHYILSTIDFANVKYNKSELLDFGNGAIGYGLTWGYDSFIGPVELSFMGSNYRGFSGYFNLGFWF